MQILWISKDLRKIEEKIETLNCRKAHRELIAKMKGYIKEKIDIFFPDMHYTKKIFV